MTMFTHDSLTVSVADEGSGPPIVFLHNGGTSSTIWRHQVADLSATHRVITVDLPGFGASPRPETRVRLDGMVDLVAALVDASDAGGALVVGNCMGTNIAARLARSRPDLVRGVLAINPLTELTFSAGGIGVLHTMRRHLPATTRMLRSVSRRVRTPRPVTGLVLRFQLGPRGIARGVHRDPDLLACQRRRDQLPALLDVLDDMSAYGHVDATAGASGVPTWIVWGEHNRVLDRHHGTHLPGLWEAERVEVLDGCGHLPMLEDPDAVTALVRECDARTTPTRSTTTPRRRTHA